MRALGVQTDIATAGSIFGLSRTQAYVAATNGVLPVPVIKVGRRYLVPTAPILRLLGLDPDDRAVDRRSGAHRPDPGNADDLTC